MLGKLFITTETGT